jgi:carboxypeptidase Q
MNFLASEGALATVEISSRDGALIRVMGYTYAPEDTPKLPRLVMMAEHYNHILRLVESGRPVTLALDVAAKFHDEDTKGYNVIAEIPGSDKASELVMAGGHYDSWHAGTGASDNGAGVVVVMEAMRILKQLDLKPRRTIRMALWAGEEQGLIGSNAYVSEHFASRPVPKDPEQKHLPPDLRDPTWPIKTKSDFKKLSVYFNLDNGSGKIRGLYTEDNAAVKPIFDAWFAPFHDLGADTDTLRGTGGTDHLSFDEVGLPGFQFIQDKLDYMTRLHHTNIDTIDHVQPDDLKQAAVILASFLYNAAMRDEMIPRKPMPRGPDTLK